MIREILFYQTANGKQPFVEWLESLRDVQARARIKARLDRVLVGQFGDARYLSAGVWELRFHFGPAYRVYYGLDGNTLVLILCGGDKSSQTEDVLRARVCWADYLRRKR